MDMFCFRLATEWDLPGVVSMYKAVIQHMPDNGIFQ
jgi:hypothetical protein